MADELFDRVLRKAFHRSAVSEGCPDPSELAAFARNNVSANERRNIQTHVSSCGRCAAELALLLRLEEPAEAPRAATAWWPRLRWAIPVATVVLVFAVWRELPRNPAEPGRGVSDTPAAVQKRPPELNRESQHIAEPSGDTPVASAPSAREDRPASRRRRASDPFQAPAPGVSGGRTTREADSRREKTLVDAASPPPARDELEARQAAPSAPPADTTPPQSTVAVGDLKSSAAAHRAKRPQAKKGDDDTFSRPSVMAETVSLAFAVSATDRVQVRVIGGNVERSVDAGTTWTTERRRLPAVVTVGACPSADICWLAGDSGYVLRREPTGRWIDARLPVDSRVTAISAADGLRAAATTEDERRFTTGDGGRTWTPAP